LLSEKSVKFPKDTNVGFIKCHQVKFKEDRVFQSIWYAEYGDSTNYYYFAILIEIKGIGQITKVFTSQGNSFASTSYFKQNDIGNKSYFLVSLSSLGN